MTEKEKKLKRVIVILVISMLLLIGGTFAYFMAQTKDEANINVNLISDRLDNLTYVVDKDISLSVNQFNLASGEDNVTDTSTATVSFIANQTSKSAEAYYNIYFYIESNPYIYTTEDKKPEIILNIYDVNNNEIISIEGLDYVNAENANGEKINGFDITEKAGLYTVSLNTKITSNSSITATKQTWKVKLTFVNLTSNQVANENKKLIARMILNDKTYKTKITEVCQSGDNLANCIIALSDSSGSIATNIYHHDGTLENGINDGSYRYAGPSGIVNNFVCFGYDASPCPEDNLYRIIGVIDEKVKLIKYDYANSNFLGTNGSYLSKISTKNYSSTYKGKMESVDGFHWNTLTHNNNWKESNLNIINLNTNFLNNIGNEWSNKIATATWQVGGNSYTNIAGANSQIVYQNEIVNPLESILVESKIGLMYVSDYGFAVSPNKLTEHMNNFDNFVYDNWMYMGIQEWTIKAYTNTNLSYSLTRNGKISYTNIDQIPLNAVRPVFSLVSETTYSSGDGTINLPIIIEI